MSELSKRYDSSPHRPPFPPPPQRFQRESSRAHVECSMLFVTGIHPYLTEEELTILFEKYGRVE